MLLIWLYAGLRIGLLLAAALFFALEFYAPEEIVVLMLVGVCAVLF